MDIFYEYPHLHIELGGTFDALIHTVRANNPKLG